MEAVKLQRYLVAIFSILFLVALIIVSGVEMKRRGEARPVVELSGVSKDCVDCHEQKGIAVKAIEEWRLSVHAEKGIGCIECHEATEGEWDAKQCEGSDIWVARYPTPKDCKECHEDQVKQFANSKHAIAQLMMASKGADRNVYEPTITTKHGCEQCHQIGNYWPDGSVGECDACHSKHRFSFEQARRPETCGECHLGPDHPQIEIYLESKHGNMYTAFGDRWDWHYPTKERVPFDAPTCATCHMSSAPPAVKSTHNVSDRLAWEIQSPFSIRTTEYWGGKSWQDKRKAMKAVCYQCHGPSFVDRYLLVADLAILQYNEMYRATRQWMELLAKEGIIPTSTLNHEITGAALTTFAKEGYDQQIEQLSYYNWHHEGRRYRMGAIMMGADFTQWHGVWDMLQNLQEIINYGAEHGSPEAKAWVADSRAGKFHLFPWYDIPGSTWGTSVLAFKSPLPMNRLPNYWERVYKNVEAAYQKGLLTDDQWTLYNEIYNNREKELGLIYDLPPIHEEYLKVLKRDLKEEVKRQVLELELPSGTYWPSAKMPQRIVSKEQPSLPSLASAKGRE